MFFFGALHGAAAQPEKQSPPNIVLILTDDLGYGDVSFLNPDSKVQTPHMDALARTGVYLTDAHSPSAVCTPTRYSILTGKYPWRHPRLKKGVLMPWAKALIRPGETTMASLLKQAGYKTACIGKWHLGFDWPWAEGFSLRDAISGWRSIATPEMFDWTRPIACGPTDVGFDTFFGLDCPNFPPYAYIKNRELACEHPVLITPEDLSSLGVRGFIHGTGPGKEDWNFQQVLPTLVERAVDTIAAASADEQPFFLWFATTSPHTPVVPTEEFQGKSQASHYGDFVAQTDDAIGQVVEALKANDLFDNTLLIVTSDNGPSALIQYVIKEHDHLPAGHFRGMKWDSWEGGHRVPLIVSWPAAGISGGKRIEDLVLLTDLYATFAAIAGAAMPDGKDSMNILKTFKGEGPVRSEMVYQAGNGNLGLRQDEWVLLKDGGGKEEPEWRRERLGIQSPDAEIQLFNLSSDPGQRINIADEHTSRVGDMSARLQAIKDSTHN